uniref:MIF4G domain-containing protein n=1 Tax=Heterorhabditis bacteriophora TaxID=37862 RepID=A0A1I7XK41_HETBA
MATWPRQTDAQWLEDTKKRMNIQEQHRNMLMGGPVIDEGGLRSLDSTLKKTTAFMKKLKSLNAQTVPALIVDLKKLNLSKFVEEMANGIAEIKLKVSEVPPVIDLCVEIAARYIKFSELLLMEIKKGLPLKKSDKITNPAKLRIDIRCACL